MPKGMRQAKPQRNADLVAYWERHFPNVSFKDVGRIFDVSDERARQIVRKVHPEDPIAAVK